MTDNVFAAPGAQKMWPPFDIAAGPYRARVSGVGGGLVDLSYDGDPLVVGYNPDEVRPNFRGALLIPWPNRVINARYAFAGKERQLAITEVDRGHALHGLAAWTPFTAVDQSEDAISLVGEIPAQDGYPFHVLAEVTYRLDPEGGLDWAITAYSMSGPAPVGLGMHPYLTAGGARVDDMRVSVPFTKVYETSGPRLLPGQVRDVAETPELDLRSDAALAGRQVDHAYAGAEAPVSVIELRGPDGAVGVRMVTESPWLQVHTADRPGEEADRIGLAVEPMTCAPAAFNDLAGGRFPVDVLDAGDSISLACSISAILD